MAEGTFEYECMRAELLGLEKPDEELFELERKARLQAEQAALESEQLKELDSQDEQIASSSGKMDDLNSILSKTQMKLNKFKSACGSLTNLLKIRGGTPSADSPDNLPATNADTGATIENAEKTMDNHVANLEENVTVARKATGEIQEKMTSHLDKLDSLISKAENAQMSMTHQNKQMKKML